MGQAASERLPEKVENLGSEVLRQARSWTEIASLTYAEFQTCLNELNALSNSIIDQRGRKLVFAVKKGTDTSILWKSTIRIACVRVNVETSQIESFKLLTLSQLLNVAHTLQAHSAAVQSCQQTTSTPSELFSTSTIMDGTEGSETVGESFTECCICIERKPDVMLPCAHSYCLPCIEQWNVSHKTCPICREKLESTDDTWVISEAPNSEDVNQELKKSLLNLSG